MKYNKIVLAGGNGYLGTVLANYYKTLASEVIILSRKFEQANGTVKTIVWDGKTEGDWVASLENADMLVNLCGKHVNCRYTQANMDEIFASRLIPTELLGKVIGKLKMPPQLWINITSSTIYRHAEDRPQDETTGEIGEGFSVEVCKKWERTFFKAPTPHTRKVALRASFVLGPNAGAFPTLLNLAKFGLGGKQGSGRQYVSWIYEQDVACITDWLMSEPGVDGVLNCTGPAPVKNAGLMAAIRKVYGIPFGLPSPTWLLTIGAWLMRSETELILKSRWVLPHRLLNEGYIFKVDSIEKALEACKANLN